MKKCFLIAAVILIGGLVSSVVFAGGNSEYRKYQLSRITPDTSLTYEYKSFQNLDAVLDEVLKIPAAANRWTGSKLPNHEEARQEAYSKISKYVAKYPRESQLYILRSYYAPTDEMSIKDLNKAINLDPTNDIAYVNLADVKYNIFRKKNQIYVSDRDRHVQACQNDKGYYNRLNNSQELKNILSLYDKAVKIRPDNTENMLLRSSIKWAMCNTDEAKAEIMKSLSTSHQ